MIREPVLGSYRGHRIYTFPPPSSGGVALIEALNILEGFDLAPLGAGSSASVHRIAEAMKLAFADTFAFVGDPDFVSRARVAAHGEAVRRASCARASTPTAWWRRAPWRWVDGERPIRVEGPGLPAHDAGTTHLSTSDAAGNAVALTMTINTPYGSGITAEAPASCSTTRWTTSPIAPELAQRVRARRHRAARTRSRRASARSRA